MDDSVTDTGDTADVYRAKRPLSAAVSGPYGHPFHPILVTVPIGAWIASVVFDIAAQFVADPEPLTVGAEWLIAIGVIGALAAACVGFADLMVVPPGGRAFRTAVAHMAIVLVVTVAYVLNFLWRLGDADSGDPTAAGPLVLSIVSVIALAIGGLLGGKLAFRYGVRVAAETTQATGFKPRTAGSSKGTMS